MKRKLKVSTLYRDVKRKPTAIPHLRLTGDWMRRAGFNPGDSVSVTIDNGALVVKLEA